MTETLIHKSDDIDPCVGIRSRRCYTLEEYYILSFMHTTRLVTETSYSRIPRSME
jgi:hypothetical protein